jgi:hypothetical protein
MERILTSPEGVGHMTTFLTVPNRNVNVVVHRFQTVGVSLVRVVAMITEEFPGAVIFQHPVRAIARVVSIELQFASEGRRHCQCLLQATTGQHSLDQPRDVLLQPRVRIPNSDRRVSESEGTVTAVEGWINRVETVTKDGVWDSSLFSVIIDNLDVSFADKLRRRDELEAPIPVGLTKIQSRLRPCLLVDSELGGGLNSSGLKDLLSYDQ